MVLWHSIDVKIERIDLPGVSIRDARVVARRRVHELQSAENDLEMEVSSLVVGDRKGSALWLFWTPVVECAQVETLLALQGLRADRLVPHAFAIGGLATTLPPVESGLTALVWLHEESATCVIADHRGWVFGRKIQLRYLADRKGGAQAGSGLELESEAVPAEDPRLDCLSTELQRTFLYLTRELALGEVVRVVLCGKEEEIPELDQKLERSLGLESHWLGSKQCASSRHPLRPLEAAAMGLSLLPRRVSDANLLPTPIRLTRMGERLTARLTAILACMIVGLTSLSGMGFVEYRRATTTLRDARAELNGAAALHDELAHALDLRQRVDRIEAVRQELDRPEPPWASMLDLLGRMAPADLFVERLETWREPEGWRLRLAVGTVSSSTSASASSVESYRQSLAGLDLFSVTSVSLVTEPGQQTLGTPEGVSRYLLEGWVAPVESHRVRQ